MHDYSINFFFHTARQSICYTIYMNISYAVKRTEIFLGKELRYGEPAGKTFVRLSNNKSAMWKRPVHEVWDTGTHPRVLNNPLIHYSGTSIDQFVKKLNYYTEMNAHYLHTQKVRTSFIEILLYPAGKFLYNYIVKQGFRDGTHGFIHAMCMSMHSFMTRAKLYTLQKNSA